MPSLIDPTKPVDGSPAVKADLRANLQSAKDEIEALQTGKTDFGHQHVLADVTDSGALASKDIVQSEDIAAAAITTEKLAAAAVGGAELADAVVTTAKLVDGAVTSDKLAAASVTVGKIGSAAVNTAELADDAVTMAKLAHGTVNTLVGFDASGTPGEVAAGSHVTISAGIIAVVPGSLTDLTDTPNSYLAQGGRFLRANVSETAVEFALIGANAIADGAVATAKLADSAVSTAKIGPDAVGNANLAAAAVTSDKIADGAVVTAKLANAAITSAKIDSNAVDSGKIVASAVTGEKIAPGAVSTTKLADGAVTSAKIAADAVGATQLQDGIPIDMLDQQLTRPQLKDFSETSTTPPVSSGSLTLDLETGNVFEVVLTEDVTSLILAGAPASGRAGAATLILRQDATGGRTLSWPGSVKWPGGAPPAVTAAANAIDIYAIVTRDGGTTWYGFPGGQDFS
jgi:trimeric autotransporter adhesin